MPSYFIMSPAISRLVLEKAGKTMAVKLRKEYRGRFLRKGFTLIELINVIVIIGILAIIAFPRFINFRDQATIARDQGILGALRSAIYINYTQSLAQCGDNSSCDGSYPADIDTLVSLVRWDPPDLACSYNWTYINGTPAKPSFCP